MNHSLRLWHFSAAFLLTLLSFGIVAAQDTETESKSTETENTDAEPFKEVSFTAADGLEITADLYWKHDDKSKPFIVLCHQAGWSRGEYREIAPALNELGFNCMAIDQRSGGGVKGIKNETNKRASAAKMATTFVDAEQDMVAAVEHARENYATGKLILWGSSYSAALTLRIAGEHADKIDGAMSFAPGEYFERFEKPANWIQTSAKKIECPVFITSAKNEKENWEKIFAAIPSKIKNGFLPKTKGNHGSRALWAQFGDSKDYWQQVKVFLAHFGE
jgi:pimeloyl-ACP methyl ester carboxylesterase